MKLKTLLQEFVTFTEKIVQFNVMHGITDIIDVQSSVYLDKKLPSEGKELSVTFGRVDGDFYVCKNNLITMQGFPKYVGGSASAYGNNIKSFELSPSYIGGDFDIGLNKIKSLIGIHKHIKYMGNTLILDGCPIKEGGLGLLWIDGLKCLTLDLVNKETQLYKFNAIINKYLKLAGGKDAWKYIEECRDELENNGLHEFAKE